MTGDPMPSDRPGDPTPSDRPGDAPSDRPGDAPARPGPRPSPVSQPFWEAAGRRELLLQHCAACDRWVFYPRRRCPYCWADELGWRRASGAGTVASFTAIHRPGHPAFAHDVPYVVALIDLAEGPRMLSNVVGCPFEEVEVGMPVEVVWDESGEATLPHFRPRRAAAGRQEET